MITESVAASRQRFERLISPDVGVVHRIDPGVTQYDHPRLAPTFAQLCDTRPLFGAAHSARANGMGEDRQQSWLAAAGEASERYCATHVPQSRVRLARAAELADAPTVAPQWLAGRGERGPIRWVPGSRLRPNGPAEPAWIAASRAYLTDVGESGEIAVPTSTGLACHHDPWRALQSALLEVIERDAMMITWLSRAGATPLPTTLRWTGTAGNPIRFDRAAERYRLYLLDSPTRVPVVFAVAFGADGQPGAAVGAAAHPQLGPACRKALVEAHQTMTWAAHMRAEGRTGPSGASGPSGPSGAPGPSEYRDLDEHVAHYLDPTRAAAFAFLDQGDAQPLPVDLEQLPPVAEPETVCRRIVAQCAVAALDCFAVDVTAPEVRAAGLWVIRAVVPGLYPLLVGTGVRPDHPRLAADAIVNADPHPFP